MNTGQTSNRPPTALQKIAQNSTTRMLQRRSSSVCQFSIRADLIPSTVRAATLGSNALRGYCREAGETSGGFFGRAVGDFPVM